MQSKTVGQLCREFGTSPAITKKKNRNLQIFMQTISAVYANETNFTLDCY